MGCECCKEVNPKEYELCQLKLDAINRRSPTSHKRYTAPCGMGFDFGAKYTEPKKKKKRKK